MIPETCKVCGGDIGKTTERMIDDLVAENVQLRAALNRIAKECTMFVWGDIAREALAGNDDHSDDGCGAVHP